MLQVRSVLPALVTLFLVGGLLAGPEPAQAQANGFVNELVVPGIQNATTIAFLPGGRMLVGELDEKIWLVEPGASGPNPTPFLQLDNSQLFAEQGLIDILPDPNFATNGHYYVFYTRGFPGAQNHNRVSRFTASGSTTVPGSEVVLWQDDMTAGGEHHGGTLAFGNDGKLYFTVGDGGFPFQPQNLTVFGGKLLRINLDGTTPTDNPFFDGPGPNKDQIWARGLRNPFRMTIDPVTGHLYVGDVGENSTTTSVEEVNLGAPGANYGWPLCEGSCALAGMTNPVFEYVHPNHDSAITLGLVYRGTQFPAQYVGTMLFADYAQGWIRQLILNPNGTVASIQNFWPANGSLDDPLIGDPVKLVVGPDGSLYYVDIGFDGGYNPNTAAIRRIRFVTGNQPPVCVASGAPTSGPAPLLVSFSSAGSFDPEGSPLSFLWNFGDGFSSNLANPVHNYTAAGPYVARLSVSDGTSTTLSNDVNISVGSPPSAALTSPADGSTFRAGDAITFSGSATDPDQGQLPASALSWTILFRHDQHFHPGGSLSGVSTGTLTIPTSGHDFSGNTRYEIILTATDASGLSSTTSVTVFPEKVNLTFGTDPAGLAIDIDGVRKPTPLVLDSLKGFVHTINAPQQTSLGASYGFSSWSDGGAQSHSIVTPNVNSSYVAEFEVTANPGLVAAYSFDDGSGTTAADDSGNGNLAAIGSAAWTPAGRFGSALQFDGSARAAVSDSPSLDLTEALTLMAWVRPAALSTYWNDVIIKEEGAYYLLADTPDGNPAAGGTFHPFGPLHGAGSLPLNQWTHLATSYDGAFIRLYVGGVQVASQALTGPIDTTNLPLSIGGHSTDGAFFTGTIDEIRIYNRALTGSEIQQLMSKAVRPLLISPPNGCGIGPELALLLPVLMALRRRARS
jgi:glucose/arabinose dehydrogenase